MARGSGAVGLLGWWIVGAHWGCSGPASDCPTGACGEPVAFLSGPTLRDNPDAGLTAWLDVSLDAPAALVIEVAGPDRTHTQTSGLAADHSVLLLGLHPETAHEITVRAVDALGRTVATDSLTLTTGPLPDNFFAWQTPTSEPERMEPGVTLVGFGEYLVMIDPQGHPVWYMPIPGAIHEATRLANGDLIVLSNRTTVSEVDLAGRIVRQWRAARTTDAPAGSIPVDVDALHHDVTELPDGHLVALSIERRWIEAYPSSETDPTAPPQPAWVAGDVVVEFTPEGEVVARWPLLDRLDPLRVAYDAVRGNYWEDFAPWSGDDVKDWSHGNAVSYDPPTDTLLVSLRHQDAVVGLSRTTGEVRWIVAPQANWPASLAPLVLGPEAPEIPAYHQHGVKFTPDGTVMLFDNGNNRASAFESPIAVEDNVSRGLEIALDPEAGTWRTLWSFGADLVPSHYAGSQGDVDPLPQTDNVLVTFGNIGNPALGGVRLVEVTRAGEPVWDLVVPFEQATTFRSQRLSGILPGL